MGLQLVLGILLLVSLLSMSTISFITANKERKLQGLRITCKCGNELCTSGSFESDLTVNGENHVKYTCTKCGAKHDFNFDVAPLPISWKELRKDGKFHI